MSQYKIIYGNNGKLWHDFRDEIDGPASPLSESEAQQWFNALIGDVFFTTLFRLWRIVNMETGEVLREYDSATVLS